MALTVSYPSKGGNKVFDGDGLKMKLVAINKADAHYLTNGFDLVPADVGMDMIIAINFMGPSTTHVKDAYWTGSKVVCFSDRAGTQVANDTDIAGEWLHFLVFGR
jgi:hypothetical protein